MNKIKMAWSGQERLWKVFWLYNFLAGAVLGIAMEFIPEDNMVLIAIAAVIALAWGIWVMVSLWRCAFNTEWRGWGYIARGLVVLSVVSLVSSFVLPFLDDSGVS